MVLDSPAPNGFLVVREGIQIQPVWQQDLPGMGVHSLTAARRPHITKSSVKWSDAKHTITALWSCKNVFCDVLSHASLFGNPLDAFRGCWENCTCLCQL